MAEGTRWLKEVVRLMVTPDLVFYTEQWSETAVHAQLLHQLPTTSLPVSESVMAAMSDTKTPPGILLVLPFQRLPIPASSTFALILDGVTNPGNLGTILRTAAAAGVDAVLLGPIVLTPITPKWCAVAWGRTCVCRYMLCRGQKLPRRWPRCRFGWLMWQME